MLVLPRNAMLVKAGRTRSKNRPRPSVGKLSLANLCLRSHTLYCRLRPQSLVSREIEFNEDLSPESCAVQQTTGNVWVFPSRRLGRFISQIDSVQFFICWTDCFAANYLVPPVDITRWVST